MPSEDRAAVPGPDEFDRQLRDITSGAAGTARFREPSAQERARQAAQRPPRPPVRWRHPVKSRKPRKPASAPGSLRGRPAPWRRRRLRVVGGRNVGRPARGSRRARLRSIAKGTGILIGFVALLLLMHLLGLGPQ